MHDRIKALWDTAAKLESDPSWAGQTKFIENFAELIVAECLSVIESNIQDPGECTEWTFLGFKRDLEKIKQHFGIE